MESVSRRPQLRVRFSPSSDASASTFSARATSRDTSPGFTRRLPAAYGRSVSMETQIAGHRRNGVGIPIPHSGCQSTFSRTSTLPEDFDVGDFTRRRRPSSSTIMTIDEYRDMLHDTQRKTLAEWMHGKSTAGSPAAGNATAGNGSPRSTFDSQPSTHSPDRTRKRHLTSQHVENGQVRGRHNSDDDYVTLRHHLSHLQQSRGHPHDVTSTSLSQSHGPHYRRRHHQLNNRPKSLSSLPAHVTPWNIDMDDVEKELQFEDSFLPGSDNHEDVFTTSTGYKNTESNKQEENNNNIHTSPTGEDLKMFPVDAGGTPTILSMSVKQCNETYGLVSLGVQDNTGEQTSLTQHSHPSTSGVSGSDFTDNVFADDRSASKSGSGDNKSSETRSTSDLDADEEDETRLDDVDIVGESFEARFPWQRDVSTQCEISSPMGRSKRSNSLDVGRNKRTYSTRSDTTPAKKSMAFKTTRPHSMGHIDLKAHQDELTRISEEQNLRRLGLSEGVAAGFGRRRNPLLVLNDEMGSTSDLESIQEDDRSSSTRDSLENAVPFTNGSRKNSGGVLASPRVSPEMWRNVPDVIVNTDDGLSSAYRDRSYTEGSIGSAFLAVPRKHVRRRSIGSVNSGSDESDQEPSPAVARRGRRAAIVDTKNFGDVSPDASPSNSCDEGDPGTNIAGRMRRRRSSVDLATNAYPGDLLVQEHHKRLIKRNTISDFYANRNGSTPVLNDENKKQRQTFSLLKLMKTRSKESLSHLEDILQKMKLSEFKDNHLAAYKTIHWTDLVAGSDKQTPGGGGSREVLNISGIERKRRESVWELFKSECVFLIDHLMALKHCFLEPLKKVQVEGFLMYAEPLEIFSNLDDLCYVSYTFCKDFIAGLVKDMSATDFGRTSVLIKALQRYSTHSKDASIYHTYCLNYSNALSYLEKLRKNDDFCDFEKWCEQDPRCNRLQLADLLISPMQHCTKLPLLLQNIKKYTQDPVEKQQIIDSLEKVELSLKQLEDKMKWLKNFERVQDIQRHLVWPSVTDLDSRAFIPEYLKSKLLRQPCERLLACPSRQLLHEGAITLTESTKSFDAHIFLFDDILLITKSKKSNRKQKNSIDSSSSGGPLDRQMFTVHRQPLPLDRLGIHDVSNQEGTANGLKNAFVIVQISRFQQIIDVFTLQASSEMAKNAWILHIRDAKSQYCLQTSSNRLNSNSCEHGDEERDNISITTTKSDCRPDDNKQRRSSSSRHGKSNSIDAVFL